MCKRLDVIRGRSQYPPPPSSLAIQINSHTLDLQDLLAGIAHIKRGNFIANQHRKKQAFLGSRLAGYVVSTLHSSSISFIKGMTQVERHAELVYAESMFEKALLGIVYSGDWLAFIKEAYVSLLHSLILNHYTHPASSQSQHACHFRHISSTRPIPRPHGCHVYHLHELLKAIIRSFHRHSFSFWCLSRRRHMQHDSQSHAWKIDDYCRIIRIQRR